MPRPPLIESEPKRKLFIAALMGGLLLASVLLAWPTTTGVAGVRAGQWFWQELGPAAVPVPTSWEHSELDARGVPFSDAAKWSDPQRESRHIVTGLLETDAPVSRSVALVAMLDRLQASLGVPTGVPAERVLTEEVQVVHSQGVRRLVVEGGEGEAGRTLHDLIALTPRRGGGRAWVVIYLHDRYRPGDGGVAQQDQNLMTQIAFSTQWDNRNNP